MEKADTAARGKIVLATVKGDVHDIGKNLVEIILANNGYQVVNLGIKVPPEALIQRVPRAPARCHRPLRPAGEERAADGDHGDRSEDRRHRRAAAGGRRGALGEIHPHQDRPGVWRGRLLCQGRHDRAEPDEPADGSGGARRGAGRHITRWKRPPPWTSPPQPLAPADHAGAARKVRTDIPIPAAPYLERKRARRAAPGGGVELHQSVHAVRPAPGLQGQFRKGPGGARSRRRWNCSTTWKR